MPPSQAISGYSSGEIKWIYRGNVIWSLSTLWATARRSYYPIYSTTHQQLQFRGSIIANPLSIETSWSSNLEYSKSYRHICKLLVQHVNSLTTYIRNIVPTTCKLDRNSQTSYPRWPQLSLWAFVYWQLTLQNKYWAIQYTERTVILLHSNHTLFSYSCATDITPNNTKNWPGSLPRISQPAATLARFMIRPLNSTRPELQADPLLRVRLPAYTSSE